MNRRKNFFDTVSHVKPENIILDLGGNPLSSMEGRSMQNLLDFLGYPHPVDSSVLPFGKVRRIDERILKYLDIDTRSIGEILKPDISQYKKISASEYVDEWGIRRTFNGMYWNIKDHPLKGATIEDLNDYQWPDGFSINESQLAKIKEEAKYLYENTDYVICAEHPVYGVFELGCWLCGFDDFLVKMVMDESFVIALFDKIFDYQVQVIEKYYSMLGMYIHYTSSGDDFGTQNGLFLSPDLFEKVIKPYLAERIRITKKFTKAKYLHHTCGSVYKIINQLTDCGVDILNPIQPEAVGMQPERIKDLYGEKIVFHGGIGTQRELISGTKEEIDEYVEHVLSIMNVNGGYIVSMAHNIQEDVPSKNIVSMFEAARKYGRNTQSENDKNGSDCK